MATPGDDPFADPSVTQAAARSGGVQSAIDDYTPFGARGDPPVLNTTSQAPPQPPAGGQADLLKRQEELERKAQELQRREQQLNATNTRVNNWPPLPSWSPVQACFYQDIGIEIPQQFQRMVNMIYYLWLAYAGTLVLNFIGSLANFIHNSAGGSQFGVSIIQLALFTPCSFVLWFRPLYKAFRADSSFNFMVFFFMMFGQIVFAVIQSMGISSFGTCGWFNALGSFDGTGGGIAIGIIMMLVAACFTACTAGFVLGLLAVHRLYRTTGASWSKAQQEFSTGIVNNPGVQNVAANAAQAAVRTQMGGGQGAGGDYRY